MCTICSLLLSFWTRLRGEGCAQDADATPEDLLLDFIGICLFDLLFPPFLLGFSVRVLHHALWTTLWILDFRKQILAKSRKKGSHSSAKPNGKFVQKVGSKQREPHARVRAEVDDVVRLVGNSPPFGHVSLGPRKRGEVRRPSPPSPLRGRSFVVGAAGTWGRVRRGRGEGGAGEGRGSPP